MTRDDQNFFKMVSDAINVSREALTKIDAHVVTCMRRNQDESEARTEMVKSIGRVHQRLDDLMGRWLRAGLGVMGGLLVLIGWLLINGRPWER